MPFRFLALFGGLVLIPEPVPGAVNENVFEIWLADRNALNLSGECFDNVGNEAMSVIALQAHLSSDHRSFDVIALADLLRQRIRVFGLQQDDIAADLGLQLCGSTQGDQVSLAE